ncbi:hypothetical protein N039_09855 [Staphylococcus sp. EGD-HP3]|nr:hypothetical protein N039_09855 [Staphylococcus sp. EGD-HP3]
MAAGVDFTFAIVTGLVIIGFILALFIREDREAVNNREI